MRIKPIPAKLAVISLLVAAVAPAVAADESRRFEVEIEAGPVWQSRNDVQIPNTDEGTRFSLVDLVGKGPWPAARLYFAYNINPKHSLRLLLAPLSVTETGTLGSQVDFAGETFEAGVSTEGTYRFNSWRVTYRYRFYRSDRWRLHIGFTAKIRDAEIRLEQEGKSAGKTDLGFVPLLHFAADYAFAGAWHVALDLDALAGGPGRAEDAALTLGYDISDGWRIKAGYRTVEGGADVEEVYNFAWLHFALISASYGF